MKGIPLAKVHYKTAPVTLVIAGNHRENLVFHLIDYACSPLVLGYPWLKLHNPHTDWLNKEIIACSP